MSHFLIVTIRNVHEKWTKKRQKIFIFFFCLKSKAWNSKRKWLIAMRLHRLCESRFLFIQIFCCISLIVDLSPFYDYDLCFSHFIWIKGNASEKWLSLSLLQQRMSKSETRNRNRNNDKWLKIIWNCFSFSRFPISGVQRSSITSAVQRFFCDSCHWFAAAAAAAMKTITRKRIKTEVEITFKQTKTIHGCHSLRFIVA